MRILFLCQLLPYPPDSGPKVRAYYVLRWLAKEHQVTLLAFKRSDDDQTSITHLESFCDAVHVVDMKRSRLRDLKALGLSLFKQLPFVIQRDSEPEMQKKASELISKGKFDRIHTDQLWMAQYALPHLPTQSNKSRFVLDEHNACYQVFQRLSSGEQNLVKKAILAREWRSLKKYETRILNQYDHVVTVTQDDRQTLQSLLSDGQQNSQNVVFDTIPICVDVEAVPIVDLASTDQSQSSNILHLGTMFWLPNVEGVLWFAHEVFPIIRNQIPDASFTIVGKNPPAEIRELAAERNELKEGFRNQAPYNSSNPSVTITGYVAEPAPYLAKASVFIVPLLSGSGMRVKILDAWRWGLPVVSTTIGAEGIQYLNGDNILIADGKEEFANAVIQLLTHPEANRNMRVKGRNWVEEQYNWEKVYSAWENIYS